MYNMESKEMSFNFSSDNINQFKAQSAYKDGSGMGGGGMYFRQNKKRKDQPEDDIFETHDEHSETMLDEELKEEDIPQDNIVNKFVNWFRPKNS